MGSTCETASGGFGLCCAGGCADFERDPTNCGNCGIQCGANQQCVNGGCQ
jgi:hypothetical protein